MVPSTKVNGSKASFMAKASLIGAMDHLMKEAIKSERSMDTASIYIHPETYIKENGSKGISMEWALFSIRLERLSRREFLRKANSLHLLKYDFSIR